jgi:hypothetical protein
MTAMRLYLDTNIYSFVAEAGQQAQLGSWLTANGHQVILSDVLCAEALAIQDEPMRMERLEFWAELPAVTAGCLGELQAREVVSEVRRLRPGWLRVPSGDQSQALEMLAARREGWRLLRDDPESGLAATGNYREAEEGGIQGAMRGQQVFREDALQQRTTTDELLLGEARLRTRPLDFADDMDFCRTESLYVWFQALYQHKSTLEEYSVYAEPFVDLSSVDEAQFTDFWLDGVSLDRTPRGWATSLATFAQLNSRIVHGNSGDARHGGHVLDADVMITADRGFSAALELVAAKVPGAAPPLLLERRLPDPVGQLAQAVA